MWGMTARQNRRMAESLVTVISCQSASEAAIMPPAHARPALLTIISTLPKRSTADATTRSGSPESPTSAATHSTSTPNRLPMSLAVLERRSAPRATRTRFTPLSANSVAIARPIPALAPVTMAVFPAMPKFMSCSLHQAPVRTKLVDRHLPQHNQPSGRGLVHEGGDESNVECDSEIFRILSAHWAHYLNVEIV